MNEEWGALTGTLSKPLMAEPEGNECKDTRVQNKCLIIYWCQGVSWFRPHYFTQKTTTREQIFR